MKLSALCFLMLALTWLLSLPAVATESIESVESVETPAPVATPVPSASILDGRSFQEDLAKWGEQLGESMQHFGEEVGKFSVDPKAYIDGSEALKKFEEKIKETEKSLADHWPVFKSSVQSSVKAILASDKTWEEKKAELEEYGVLAFPYLATVDFAEMGDNAKAAMETFKEFLSTDNEDQVKAWIEENKKWFNELKAYLAS